MITFTCPKCNNDIHKDYVISTMLQMLCNQCSLVYTFDTSNFIYDPKKVIGVREYAQAERDNWEVLRKKLRHYKEAQ